MFLRNRRPSSRGDTIVEVLLAIAIAAFAIGTSYAIANRSLQHAISARERNEAVNYIQGQITGLKYRKNTDANNFNTLFAVPSGFPGTGTAFHFCLNEQSTGPNDPNNYQWTRYDNNLTDATVNNLVPGNPGYNNTNTNACVRTNTGTDYYLDAAAMVTNKSIGLNPNNRTVYKFVVSWNAVGSGGLQQAVIYYRF